MSQQYSLRWNNHQPNFISTFTTLLTTRTLVDVTLAAEGKQLQAHKIVLSACSTYFQQLFVDNPSRHPIVILKDVTFADLRTMVDFMYYGEVNVTEEQLPQVLETAKLLKIKGLTEMPDSTSLTRAQGSSDFPPGESIDPQRHSASPAAEQSKRKRRRKSSSSTPIDLIPEDARPDEAAHMDLVRGDSITLSSLPQQRQRNREFQDERTIDNAQQPTEPHNMNVEPLPMDNNAAAMPQDVSNQPVQGGIRVRRSKFLKRQDRVSTEERELRKQASEPVPSSAAPPLQKHDSYPQYAPRRDDSRRPPTDEQEVRSLLIRTVTVIDRQASTSGPDTPDVAGHTQRVRHTPAVRSGPPLSCNFCWNTVDECGRILRRKTQYHCPECRTNLCIVPCFHEYHDGAETDTASAR